MSLRELWTGLGLAALLGLAGIALADEPKADEPKGEAPAASDDATKAKETTDSKDEADTTTEHAGTKTKAGGEKDKAKPRTELATFGGGCFWCLEAVFERIDGVKRVVSGYAGGQHPRPTYATVSTGLTGHAEVVQIEFDPEVVTYDTLLEVFWHCHDPTTLNSQGPDFGTQYRSIILYHNEDQREAALKSYREQTAAGTFASPIVTELVPLRKFFPAEKYHQNYFSHYPLKPYCQAEIVPKLQKLGLLGKKPAK
jgi:peptide-methionine (S)-S-oxide reductase